MEQDIQEILFSQEALARRVKELAGEIRRDYAGKAPLVVGVLRGCFVFMADLVRELNFPLTLDFMAAPSRPASSARTGSISRFWRGIFSSIYHFFRVLVRRPGRRSWSPT